MFYSPIMYPGGKSRAVKALSPYFPIGIYDVVSPFAGGCSLEIALANRGIRVRASDVFAPLVCFWRHTLERPDELARRVETYYPMTCRDKFERMKETCANLPDGIERAAQLFVLNRCSFGSTMMARKGGFVAHGKSRFTERSIRNLKQFSCPGLSVNLMDFKDALASRPHDMAYLDPPYMLRKDTCLLYGVNGNAHRGFNHHELAEVLRDRKGWVMSYNDTPDIRRMYDWANIVEVKWRYTMRMDTKKPSNEILIVCE